MILDTWLRTGQPAIETGEVIQLRLWRISAGGSSAVDESMLMVSEKMDAAIEASCSLVGGGSLLSVVERYREHVAANAERLRLSPPTGIKG